MTFVVEATQTVNRQLGHNASFLLLRHASGICRIGLDIGSAQIDANADHHMNAFEVLCYADQQGIGYWDGAESTLTPASLARLGMWSRFNPSARVIGTPLRLPLHDNPQRPMIEILQARCDVLACSQLDIVYLSMDDEQLALNDRQALEAAVRMGLVKSYGHCATTVAHAMRLLHHPDVTLLHVKFEVVEFTELTTLLTRANQLRLGVVLVLTQAVTHCVETYGAVTQEQHISSLLAFERNRFLLALRQLLDDFPCILKIIQPNATLTTLKQSIAHLSPR